MSSTAELGALRDVENVIGSFVFANNGAVLARDLPAVFDETLLSQVGRRLGQMLEAFSADGDAAGTSMLNFAEHRVYVQPLANTATIAVIVASDVNVPALKMAVNVLARKLVPGLSQRVPQPGPLAGPPPLPSARREPALPSAAPDAASISAHAVARRAAAAPEAPHSESEGRSRRPRYFRGRRID